MAPGERPEDLGGAEGTDEGGGICMGSDCKDEAEVPETVVGGACTQH
jgi:hypothetical protein